MTTQNTSNIYSYKLGTNRGHKRIWIEGQRLAKYGFNRYDRIAIYYGFNLNGDPMIAITKNPESDHKVAGRSRNGKDLPIIDINNKSVDQVMRLSNGRYNVEFAVNKLIITPDID